jgi:hypothetical protein
VADARWAAEDCFAEAKNETGLDHYQVRRYRAWYRHITPGKEGLNSAGNVSRPPRTYAPPPFITDETGRDMIPLTAAEARRLFNLHTRVTRRPQAFHEHWSGWRRYRQASARKSHYARRTRNNETLL